MCSFSSLIIEEQLVERPYQTIHSLQSMLLKLQVLWFPVISFSTQYIMPPPYLELLKRTRNTESNYEPWFVLEKIKFLCVAYPRSRTNHIICVFYWHSGVNDALDLHHDSPRSFAGLGHLTVSFDTINLPPGFMDRG